MAININAPLKINAVDDNEKFLPKAEITYGPYESKSVAIATITSIYGNISDVPLGVSFGVVSEGTLTEYQYKTGSFNETNCVEVGSGNNSEGGSYDADITRIDTELSTLSESLDDMSDTIDNFNAKNKDELSIVDANGNVITCIDKDGLKTTEVNTSKISNDSDTLYISDNVGNVAAKIDSSGIVASNLKILYNNEQIDIVSIIRSIARENALNEWEGKVYATYGDSVTAINNGDFEAPYTEEQISNAWGTRVAAYLGFSKCYGRGIGGQKFAWGSDSGAIAWVTPQGNLISRDDTQNYDDFDGTYPSGVTSAMEDNETAIRIRGCSCSWLRITKMFPESIKDNIDVVSIMYHNDAGGADTAAEWVEEDTTDPEWAESSYYETYNGDYNIGTIKGGIASTIMKLQAWMPNAILVLCTPISGNGTSGQIDTKAGNITQAIDRNMIKLADMVMEMSKMFHIPCIDVNHNDGINGLNRTKYIADTIHPYTVDGKKMVARAIIGGLKTILPNF